MSGDAVIPIIQKPVGGKPSSSSFSHNNDNIQDTEAYVEETLSLNEVEKDLIRKALEKHRGRRKAAAKDLNISERTLYRKIQRYGLE